MLSLKISSSSDMAVESTDKQQTEKSTKRHLKRERLKWCPKTTI